MSAHANLLIAMLAFWWLKTCAVHSLARVAFDRNPKVEVEG